MTPYLQPLEQSSVNVSNVPVSICVGNWRYEVEVMDDALLFKVAYVMDHKAGTIIANGFCRIPVINDNAPVSWIPECGCTVSQYLAPLFEHPSDSECLMWIIGNALVDPQTASYFVMSYGSGGNGKSTLMRAMRALLDGCCRPVDMAVITSSEANVMPRDVVRTLAMTRVATWGNIDIDIIGGMLNNHFIEVCTGG